MYEAYWGLERKPFDEGAPGGFLFRSAGYEAAAAKMLYVIEGGDCGMLIAPAGCGKTLLASALASELASRGQAVAFLGAPFGGEAELLSAALSAFGDDATVRSPEGLAERLQSALEELVVERSAAGAPAVLIVDEAHAVREAATLERLRMLLNLGGEGARPLVLLLFARPELDRTLAVAEEFDARIRARARIEPMDAAESKAYVLHRLEVAGSRRGIFTEAGADLIARACGGVPLRLNRMCELCLAMGYAMGVDRVGPDVVGEVISDLES